MVFKWVGIDAYREMVNLVCEISVYVKSVDPNYKVYVNIGGAYQLLYDNHLLSCIDGVLREELWRMWRGYNHTSPQDPDETRAAMEALSHARRMGKEFMVADPAENTLEARWICESSWRHSFIPVPQPAWAPDYDIPPLASWCIDSGLAKGEVGVGKNSDFFMAFGAPPLYRDGVMRSIASKSTYISSLWELDIVSPTILWRYSSIGGCCGDNLYNL